MSIKKSPIDELFHELYGYYPNKAGQAYELLVAAAFKIVTGQELKYDQRLRGEYSDTSYQVDGLNVDEQKVIEAKDYTIDKRKVGRPDLQKLQGALTDLDISGGIFASATDYTKPAKKYSESSTVNPLHKEIALYNIRPSTELDEKGRIKTFIINMTMIVPEFAQGEFNYAWTSEAIQKFQEKDLLNKEITMKLDRFYNSDGSIKCLMSDFSRENQPIHQNMDDDFGIGCWVLTDHFIKYDGELFGIKGIEYKIPYGRSTTTFTIEGDGKPKILIKSEDGKVDKLLTDEQFRNLTLKDGKVEQTGSNKHYHS
ncbi:restriction endonuclease [Ekhidna sp.]|uniref:restriction endonuclease n=1 Tax=Ekhidna sp. TaxID=2608089 RepID=UPI003B5CE287